MGCPTHDRPADERGQVMSSVVALVAVVAVVIGLLVLFGTWGDDHEADDSTSPSPAPSQSSVPGSGSPTGDPTTGQPTAPPATPTSGPTSAPTSGPTTRPTLPTVAPSTPVRPTSRPTSTSAPTATATSEPTSTTIPIGDQPSRVPVEIYNNTTQRGMAERVAGELRTAGWTVSGVDNWRGKVVGSTVYHQPGHRDDAEALASKLGIGRVKPALDNMRKGRLTVILTSDYVEQK